MILVIVLAVGQSQSIDISDAAFLAPSPVGGEVALVSRDGVLYRWSPENALVRVADSVLAWGVSWSPDGSAIAFVRNGRISIARNDKLTWSSQRFARPGYPAWLGGVLVYTGDGSLFIGEQSFKGFSLVATVSPNPSTREIAYTDIEGKYLLIFNPSSGKTDTVFSDPEGLALFAPQWSPDGKLLVICRAGPGFWIWSPQKREPRLISPGEAPSWSPDGRRLVYQVSQDDGHNILSSELYILDIASGRSEKLPGKPDRLMPRFGADAVFYLTIEGGAGFLRID
jgi:Tol biopolymer transport system component